jgi:predicted ATP-grasp superfamily ATP-dependent carboligase
VGSQPGTDRAQAQSVRGSLRGRLTLARGARTGRECGRRVLLTEGENVGVLGAVRALRLANYEPWVAVTSRSAPAARSRAASGVVVVPDPAVSASAFRGAIAGLAAALQPAAILPGGEKGMLALSGLERELPPGSKLAICDRAVALRATDKSALAELAAAAGLKTPETFLITAEDAAHRALPLPLPLIVKPLRSEIVVGEGFQRMSVRRATTQAQAVAALAMLPDHCGLVQRYQVGALSAVAGVFWDGKLVSAVNQRALRLWPVGCGEMSYAVALPRDPELERGICRLLTGLGWSGLFQMQFLETQRERLLIDLNPRIYGSLALALAAGQNLAATWVDVLLGGCPAETRYEPGVRFRNELLDARALFASARVRARNRSEADRSCAGATRNGTAADSQCVTTGAFFSPGDPLPLLGLAPFIARGLGSRAGARIKGVIR